MQRAFHLSCLLLLIYAAHEGKHATVQILLENGADPDITAADGSTAASVAAFSRYEAVLDLLRKAHARNVHW